MNYSFNYGAEKAKYSTCLFYLKSEYSDKHVEHAL